ncbi:MAG: large subunit ribosomal protein L19, partial [Salibacteraceae bacterium]
EYFKIRKMNPKVQQAATSNVEIAELPSFKAGDTIIVNYKIKEGAKERVQPFQGVVLKRTGKGSTGTFTVRKISNGIGIERIFPISSPFIEAIKVTKVGVVRRSKIYYLRERTGKAARIKEKRR